MCRSETLPDSPATVQAVGRQLASAAAHVNPLVGLAMAVLVPLVRLFRRWKTEPVAIRKVTLETYTRAPLPAPSARLNARQEGSKKAPRTFLEGRPEAARALRARAPKGGRHHG